MWDNIRDKKTGLLRHAWDESKKAEWADKETGLIIDKMIYLRIVSYLRKAFNITPKIEKAANKMTKKILIEEDRKKIEFNKECDFNYFSYEIIS